LCKKVGGGRIASYEIMIMTDSIAALVRDNKTYRITSDIQRRWARHDHPRCASDEPVCPRLITGERIEKAQIPEEMKKKVRETPRQA